MYIAISPVGDKGQFEKGFALEVQSLVLAGMTKDGVQFDIYHMDGETERLILGGQPYDNLSLGTMNGRIFQIRITGGFPDVMPISKEAFRAMVGQGRLLDKQSGHFIPV